MQRHRILLVAVAVACLPLGCKTVSDVFNEPPADTERSERAEDDDDTEARRAERPGERDERRRDEAREEAREEAKERQREQVAEREARERRMDRREIEREEARERARERAEDVGERRRDELARDYVAAGSCPMRVEGVQVSMVDIVDGIAIDFSAERDEDIAAVQDRARRLMNTQREVRSMRDVDDPSLAALPPARVEYDIQDDGARIEFKVDSEADLRDLRTQLRERMAIMEDEGECPMHFMTMLSGRGGRAG